MHTDHEGQFVEFGIAGENYALPIADIQEIIRVQSVTEIPNVRHYVRGVMNLRGRIVPIISLRKLFGIADDTLSKQTRIIVVNHKEESVGIIVDLVNKVTTFSDIQPPPERIGGISGAYFSGIGLTDNGLVGIMKLDELLIRS